MDGQVARNNGLRTAEAAGAIESSGWQMSAGGMSLPPLGAIEPSYLRAGKQDTEDEQGRHIQGHGLRAARPTPLSLQGHLPVLFWARSLSEALS